MTTYRLVPEDVFENAVEALEYFQGHTTSGLRGCKQAARWISLDDKHPQNDYTVLVLDNYGLVHLLDYVGSGIWEHRPSGECYGDDQYSHWHAIPNGDGLATGIYLTEE